MQLFAQYQLSSNRFTLHPASALRSAIAKIPQVFARTIPKLHQNTQRDARAFANAVALSLVRDGVRNDRADLDIREAAQWRADLDIIANDVRTIRPTRRQSLQPNNVLRSVAVHPAPCVRRFQTDRVLPAQSATIRAAGTPWHARSKLRSPRHISLDMLSIERRGIWRYAVI